VLEQQIKSLEQEIAKVAYEIDQLERRHGDLSDKIIQKKRQLQMKTNFEKE
jgi:phage shock protein A